MYYMASFARFLRSLAINCSDHQTTGISLSDSKTLGQRAIYVDGAPVAVGTKYKLSNNAVVEIAGLRFIFLVNSDLINIVRAEAAKSLS